MLLRIGVGVAGCAHVWSRLPRRARRDEGHEGCMLFLLLGLCVVDLGEVFLWVFCFWWVWLAVCVRRFGRVWCGLGVKKWL